MRQHATWHVRRFLPRLVLAAALAPAGAAIADTAVPFAGSGSVTVPSTAPAAGTGSTDFNPRRIDLVCAIAGCGEDSAGPAAPRRPVAAQSTDLTRASAQ